MHPLPGRGTILVYVVPGSQHTDILELPEPRALPKKSTTEQNPTEQMI
jgi:hypothetical protein